MNLPKGAFEELKLCTELDLGFNSNLYVEGGAFIGLNRLINLKLFRNGLTHIDSTMLTGLQDLQYLYLSFNHIATISPKSFSGLIWLKSLFLHNNYLTEIHGNMWVGLQSLDFFYLQGNSITEIPPNGISHMPVLRVLNLTGNELRTLRSDMIDPDDRPWELVLYIHGNPLQCDIELCLLNEAFHLVSAFSSDDPTCSKQGDASFQIIDLYCTSGRLCFNSLLSQTLKIKRSVCILKECTQVFFVNKTQP